MSTYSLQSDQPADHSQLITALDQEGKQNKHAQCNTFNKMYKSLLMNMHVHKQVQTEKKSSLNTECIIRNKQQSK